MATDEDERTKRRGLGLGWLVYQQVASVLGAIALAAMVGNFIDFDWRGFIASLVGYWDEYARPAAKAGCDWLISKPLLWAFGWHFEVPLLARDYFSVGVITALSLAREVKRSWPRGSLLRLSTGGGIGRSRHETDPEALAGPIFFVIMLWLPIIPLVWPLTVGAYFVGMLYALIGRDALVRDYLLVLSPIIYLGMIIALNYLVL